VAETLKQCLRLFLETCLMKTSLITINIFLEYLSCALLLELNFFCLTLLNFRIRKKFSFEFGNIPTKPMVQSKVFSIS